jgi:hypothetical protein
MFSLEILADRLKMFAYTVKNRLWSGRPAGPTTTGITAITKLRQ